ncbi:hypothetical protein NIES2101_14440 [Calothrix sp. HK-06]|nr:hypothetical protein NIES2101_14440 [Calothrix sp. HK-06]
MIISDLNALEVVDSTEVVGGFKFNEYSNIYLNEYINVNKNFKSYVNVKGNAATAEATAYGKDTASQTFTETTEYSSSSGSISFSG